MSTRYTLILPFVTGRGKARALFIVERRCEDKWWPGEGYFEDFRGAEAFLSYYSPMGILSRAFKTSSNRALCSCRFISLDSGQKEGTFTLEGMAEGARQSLLQSLPTMPGGSHVLR